MLNSAEAIVLALVTGAGAEASKLVVKDCYRSLKAELLKRFPGLGIGMLERRPDDKSRRDDLKSELEDAGAAAHSDILGLAQSLL